MQFVSFDKLLQPEKKNTFNLDLNLEAIIFTTVGLGVLLFNFSGYFKVFRVARFWQSPLDELLIFSFFKIITSKNMQNFTRVDILPIICQTFLLNLTALSFIL